MTRQILLHVIDQQFTDPMRLIETTRAQRESGSTYTRTYPLAYDPPPDTLFMRAAAVDLGVFGEDLPDGSLQLIDARHARPAIERALEANVDRTIAALVAASGNTVTAAEVAEALASGTWSTTHDKRRGAILQAAGFARCLLDAIRLAEPDERAVVWEYTGGKPTYAYP
jgi:hypothetical protein